MESYADLSLVSELIYELKAGDAMRRDLICCRPDHTLREVQQVLRKNAISGVPVVLKEELVGIVSIEDIIKALDGGYIGETVEKWMTCRVVTVRTDTQLKKAVELFEKHHYGRLPVVDAQGKPVGIITPEDIVYRLMVELTRIAEEAEQRNRELRVKTGQIETGISSVQLQFTISAGDYEKAGAASTSAKAEMRRRGVHPDIARRAAIALYEAETNVIIHSIGGRVSFEVTCDRFVAEVVDWGPGIPDVEKAMTPGWSTASEFVRALGFGAGMGLPNIRRCSDRFQIESAPGKGTKLRIEIDFKNAEVKDEPDGTAGPTGIEHHAPD